MGFIHFLGKCSSIRRIRLGKRTWKVIGIIFVNTSNMRMSNETVTTKERRKMNKLVYGVGVNDLDYRTQVYEYVTENGGERVRKPVFKCKYYAAWTRMLQRCYSKNT